ncbi:MAG: response regulator, partial [Clostridia bacterium]|nr:response regulator [Clostridia bacterium]
MSVNRILIADDDRVVHESLGIYLQAEGYECVDAYNGAEALEKLDGDISLCVLDIMMPIMSGLDVCKEIRKTSRVPVI